MGITYVFQIRLGRVQYQNSEVHYDSILINSCVVYYVRRKLHNEELRDLYSSPSIIRIISRGR
jgi:hypothetical protein